MSITCASDTQETFQLIAILHRKGLARGRGVVLLETMRNVPAVVPTHVTMYLTKACDHNINEQEPKIVHTRHGP